MSMTDHMLKSYIDQAAESAALKVATELRKDLSRGFERIGVLEQAVGVGEYSDNGLKATVKEIKEACDERHEEVTGKIRAGSTQVNKWKYLFIGGWTTLSGVCLLVGAAYKIWAMVIRH